MTHYLATNYHYKSHITLSSPKCRQYHTLELIIYKILCCEIVKSEPQVP